MRPDAYLQMAATEASHWWFAGRRAILRRVLLNLFPGRRELRILELGSGTGGNLEMLSAFGAVSAMEKDDGARNLAMERWGSRFQIAPGACPDQIPFQGRQFDLICLFDVLEHIEPDLETLRAAGEFLAPGGRIVLTVPAHQWLWSAHDDELHHVRRYSRASLARIAESAGLHVDRLTYFNSLLFPLLVAMRLFDLLLRRRAASGTAVPARPVNAALCAIFSSEAAMLSRCNLLWGSSILGVFRVR